MPEGVYFINDKNFIIIIINELDKGLYIEINSEYHLENTQYYSNPFYGEFKGWVKNKSELKKLLKQLNIEYAG